MKWIPSLDGYRALCIFLVFFLHAGWIGFGWIGVQGFFVLSGFLITRVLLSIDENKNISISEKAIYFYKKRIFRIFPIYFGLIIVYLVISLAYSESIPGFFKEFPYLVSYTENISRFRLSYNNSPYFTHFWSLAVEEQFYLLWPWVIWACATRASLTRICFSLLLAGPVVRFVSFFLAQAMNDQNAGVSLRVVYVSTFSHLDAFAAGALAHLCRERIKNPKFWAMALWICTIISGISMLLLAKYMALPMSWKHFGWSPNLPLFYSSFWGYSLLNLTFAMSIVALCRNGVPSINSILSNSIMVEFGKISYGFYLYHLPCIALAALLIDGDDSYFIEKSISILAVIVAFVSTTIISYLSHRFIELPILTRAPKLAY